ncbi:TIGR03086 family metal-binding protein [Amycolatopsis anabasis]|uniref:TIGR03086 family metal-binding protein n=1 Tax=Amycolatopsis anabasis TaxID=1840409 RepID=UPI00131BBE6D|nr:TIGR03086 family metal-binding protein [Amycolatopsis anabasis]
MSDPHFLLRSSADRFLEVVRAVEPGQLGAPTPCTEYDVRALVNHLLYWGPFLEAAARRRPAPAVEGAEREVDLTGGDWAGELERLVGSMADALVQPGAQEGVVTMHGSELPAETLTRMVLGEWVLHGWDLARATGQAFTVDDDLATALHGPTAELAERARAMKVFGPEVPVPASAPAFDRLLGLVGRDPGWGIPS